MNLRFKHGDTEILKLIVIDYYTRAVRNITGWSFWFTMKRDNANSDEDAVIQKTVGNGIEIIDDVGGEIEIRIEPSDRTAFTAGSNYKWDVQCKDLDGNIVTLAGADGKGLQGIITITADTTHAIS